MNRTPWLAILVCLALAPAAGVADTAHASRAPHSRAARARPKLAEQDTSGGAGSPRTTPA